MRTSVLYPVLTFLTAVVNAHFHFLFPPPRGAFVAKDEVLFCDGYNSPAQNRTPFPLTGGYVTVNIGHAAGDAWTYGILVSTVQNVSQFSEFELHNGFATVLKPGNFCLPLDFSNSNVTGLSDGQDITIQFVWNGGDGSLYQCADLTLSSNLSLASTVSCANQTVTSTTNASSSSSHAPSATSSGSGSSSSANIAKPATCLMTMVGLLGLLLL